MARNDEGKLDGDAALVGVPVYRQAVIGSNLSNLEVTTFTDW